MWRICLIILLIQRSTAKEKVETTDIWYSWQSCQTISGSRDQNCRGTQRQTGKTVEVKSGDFVRSLSRTRNCYLTNDVVNGGYTDWTEWDDCSSKCTQKTHKRRYCNQPTPCRGGEDCTELGIDTLEKDCGPISGQWGIWESWGSCKMAAGSSSQYGTGTYVRYRECDNPPPICTGDYCIGVNNETGNCREVPHCLTPKMFDDKFLRIESPMVIYTSAQVDIYLLTKNKCAPRTIVYNYYDLYKINTTTTAETRIGQRLWNLKFKFDPGMLDVGLYRLYAKIGYPNRNSMQHWMEESMYIKIEHPPPHAFIRGGSGRTVGQGQVNFDARSVSYSLTKGPGDPSGLTFKWKCLNFVTKSIYNLLQFNIDSVNTFQDDTEHKKKWYETRFVEYIADQVAFINVSTLYERIKYHRNLDVNCSTANQLYVKVEPDSITTIAVTTTEIFDNTSQTTINDLETTTLETDGTTYDMTTTEPLTTDTLETDWTTYDMTTTEPLTTEQTTRKSYDLIPLSTFYDINYLYEMQLNPKQYYDTTHVLELPKYDTLVKNEMLEFLKLLYGEDASSFANDTSDFFERLSESSLTLESILQLRELSGLPESANAEFFNNLENWLKIAEESKLFANELVKLLESFKQVQSYITSGLNLTLFVGVDGYFQLKIDSSGMCLLEYLGQIFEGFSTINAFNWNTMKIQEQNYLQWMQEELFTSSACKFFNPLEFGTASLSVTNLDVNEGMGYLVYIRVEFEGSVSYFIQHVQSVTGNPPELEVECRLNCMKKTALTSIMSLKATCPSCTYEQLRGFKVWWNVRDFDIHSRKSVNNTYWKSWMLSGTGTKEFVMMANVMNASTGYLIEAFLKLASGEISTGIWTVTTNILPYYGSCEIEDAAWGEKKIITTGWKDEGFRKSKDPSIDWKEQLNYRIVQMTSDGKETLLYYGSEEENYIKVKPGVARDNYQVTVKTQVFDIFIDYTECIKQLGQIYPNYTTGNDASVSSFLQSSSENVDYYWTTGNVKQVAMNVEVAGTPVTELNVTSTIFDTNPAEWVDLGVVKLDNGSSITRSFDELWNMYQYPDRGDVTSTEEITDKLGNFSSILVDVSDAVDGTATVNIDQIANSIGTIINNKDYTKQDAASNAFKGNKKLIEKLLTLINNETYPKYEDYISTCTGVLKVLNNALQALLPKSSMETPTQLDIYSIMDVLSDREKISQPTESDLTPTERAFIASEIAKKNELEAEIKNDVVKKEVEVLLESISYLGHVLQMLNYRKQMPVYVQDGHINSTEEKKLISELIESGIENNGFNIDFVEGESRSTQEQDVQVTLYEHTPFSWDTESKYISSATVTVSVSEEKNTSTVLLSKIKIPNSNLTASVKSINVAIPTDMNVSQMLIYKMYWKNPLDSLIFSLSNAIDNISHVVYIRKNGQPTEELYDWKKSIAADDWLTHSDIKVIIDGGLYSKATVVYIGVFIKGTTDLPSTRRKRSVSVDVIQYDIIAFTTGCRVWNENDRKWDKTSCKLSELSTINETICDCINPPGNSFATTFYVPPNTIDFGSVFSKFDLTNNAAVFSTVICLIVVYMLIVVWAFRQDKQDHKRWAISYLVDNAPYDEYLYMLTVYTGLHRHAGTKSKIGFMIIDGKTNKADVNTTIRQLEDETYKGFSVGSVRRFVMSVPNQIEDPSVLRIWHDNSGSGNDASWYLSKVILEDIQTQDKYVFVCGEWLSLDQDEGSIDCVIPVSSDSEMRTFSFLFNENTRENTTDSHLWLSVAIRPEESNFTRVERLACCLTFLFLTMISNAMFYGQDTGSKLSVGPITFSLSGIYISLISSLIAAPPIFIVTYIFRNSRQRSSRNISKKTVNEIKHGKLSLPFWCKFISWGIVTTAVLVSGFFLILYSMEWGKTKSEEWLLCFCMSFFESIFIFDPLKIIVLSIIFSWIIKGHKGQSINYDRRSLLAETKRRATSPMTYCIGIFKTKVFPLKEAKVTKLKQKRQQNLQVQRTFIELILYLVFLAFLFMVSFSNRDSRWFYLTDHLEQQLIKRPTDVTGDTTLRFLQVKSASDLYVWLDHTLIPFMFPMLSANGEKLKAYQRLYIDDEVNFRVGPLRLRQLRVKEDSCKTNLWDDTICYDKYSVLNEDDSNYCVGWENEPCMRGQSVYNITSAAWTFVSSLDIWGLPTTGYHSTYGGGGYIAEFVVNYDISKIILKDLYKYLWINRNTRAVFIEFTLYNSDNNVFVYISFLCEFPETGGTLISTSVKPFRPYQHVGSLGIFIFISEIIVLIGIIIFAVRKIVCLYQHGKKLLKELWNILDLLIIVLFFICTVMYIGRWIMINYSMEKFETNKNKFVNFSHIASWDEIFNILLAFIIFLTTFRIMRVLSYSERMNQLGYVLAYVSRDLCGCLVMFLLVYSAFIIFGHLVFGRQLETYKDLFVSSTTLTNAIIGKNSINDLFAVEPTLGRAYYFFFVLLLLWILMTMLNATLNVGITSVRDKKKAPAVYGITDFLLRFWKTSIGLFTTGNTKKNKTPTDYIVHKDVPKQIEVKWPKEKEFKPRRVYQ